MRSLWAFPVVVGVLSVSLLVPGLAQTITGTIAGGITDSSGAVVPNVNIKLENTATGLSRSATTSSSGGYRITELPIGTYKLTVAAPGFKTLVSTVDVSAGGVTNADFKLVVGQRTETVEVEATAPLVEFSDKLNSYVDEERIKELPLNGRDFNSLLAVTPGVQRTPGGGFLAITINGARATSNNYLVDGISNNDRFYGDSALNETGILGIPATLIPPDAIQELDVQQSPSAEFGVKGGASINLIMKSGTNAFHGSAYGFRHTSFADAANYFTKHGGCTSDCATPIRNMQFGGTFGGPIVKDKTFFFVYYEGQRSASISPFQAGIPTQGEVDKAHADIAAAGLTENPVGQTFLSFYPIAPVPDIRTGNVFLTTVRSPNIANGDSFSVKIDQRIGTKHQISGRYFFGDSVQNVTAFTGELSPPPPNKPDLFNSFAPTRAQLVGGTWTWNIDNTKILESRFGMTRFSQIIDVNNKINPADLGLDTGPLSPIDYGWPGLYYFSDFGYTGGVPGYPISTRPTQNYDWSEHFSWIKGNHSMKMGGSYDYAFTDTLRNRARSDLEVLTSDHVAAIEQVLLGKLDTAARSFGSTQRHIFQKSLGLYFMDDWKVRSRFTLSYGLRYDIGSAIGESHNLGSNFFPNRGLVDLGKGIDRLYATPRNNFGPRVGFAWDIFGNGKTALRGGYALTYDFPNFASISAPQGNFSPLNVTSGAFTQTDQGIFSFALNGAGGDPLVDGCIDPNNPSAGGAFVCITPGVSIYGPNPTGTPPFDVVSVVSPLKTPMYHLFNLSLSRELFAKNAVTIAYVGQRGRNLLLNRDLNATPIGCNVSVDGCIPPFATQYPDINHILQINNDAKSWYDSMEVSFRQQNWHGINTQYNLTWSKCLDYESANRNGRFTFVQSENPYNPAADKGFCDHDVPLNFNIGGNYAIPKAHHLGRLAGEGWEISTVLTALSGRPFNPNLRTTDPSGQGVGSVRPNYDGSPIHYHPRNPDSYVDETFTDGTNADPCGRTDAGLPVTPFYIPCDGTIGNARRNMLRGPGLVQLDGVVIKNTKITERVTLQFRWEVYNVLNRANFATTGTAALGNVTSSTFGVISSTPDVDAGNPVVAQGGPRNMVFALKVSF
jgi:hypothetical protein